MMDLRAQTIFFDNFWFVMKLKVSTFDSATVYCLVASNCKVFTGNVPKSADFAEQLGFFAASFIWNTHLRYTFRARRMKTEFIENDMDIEEVKKEIDY